MELREAIEWAQECEAGDYLIEYEDCDSTPEEDPGSRCGFDDQELDAIRSVLRGRDMTLSADDRGLLAETRDRR